MAGDLAAETQGRVFRLSTGGHRVTVPSPTETVGPLSALPVSNASRPTRGVVDWLVDDVGEASHLSPDAVGWTPVTHESRARGVTRGDDGLVVRLHPATSAEEHGEPV